MCGSKLTFGIDDSFMRGLILEANRLGLAFHPLDAVHFAPLQAPQPAVCVREGAHGYHWDGAGTWWQ